MVQNSQEILEVLKLSFTYAGSQSKALSDVSMKVKRGDIHLLFGYSGSGKSTLLQLCSGLLAPEGIQQGEILLEGESFALLEQRACVNKIGYVMQNPEAQIVTTKVSTELSFGMEQLGVERSVILRRVAEMVDFFGIRHWYHKDMNQLSGGQKQIVNLAAAMMMNPRLLLLDEPTSQLDPVAATRFLNMVKRLNEEMGVTILMAEHRMEEIVPFCQCMIFMDKGRVIAQGNVQEICRLLYEKQYDISEELPLAARCSLSCDGETKLPLTITDGRKWIRENVVAKECNPNEIDYENGENAVICKELYFQYEKKEEEVLQDVSFQIKQGETVCIMGGNGCGKTTLLKLLSHMIRPLHGKIKMVGEVGYLPQNTKYLFIEDTVEKELSGSDMEWFQKRGLLKRHPFDLSGGEAARAAITKVMKNNPDILLLDEPTKGMDGTLKRELCKWIQEWKQQEKTSIIVTHDIEFASKVAEHVIYMFDHHIVYDGTLVGFLHDNMFYTTAARRLTQGWADGYVNSEDVIHYVKENYQK